MELFLVIVLFVYGTLFGSFLNVLIDRFSTDRPVVKGRSYCEHCHKTLSWRELIPLISFLLQKGECIHCKARIPVRLFIVELLIGIIFPLLYFWGNNYGFDLMQIISLVIIVYAFVGIIFSDFKYGLIPDKFLMIVLFPIVYLIFSGQNNVLNYILSAIGAALFFLFLFVVTRGRGMGFGDVKLAFILGLFLGFPLIALSLYVAFLTGALISIILVVWGKKKFKGSTIPFGPFMVISAIIAYFFGQNYILPWVLQYI